MTRLVAVLAALCAVLGAARPCAADLDSDVQQLMRAWEKHGRVHRLPARLAERTSPLLIFAPPELVVKRTPACLTAAVLGPSSTHFAVRVAGTSAEGDTEWVFGSVAGMVEVTRCGPERAHLAGMLVEMRSPRAVLETLIVESKKPVPRAAESVPQRDPGPVRPLAGSEPRPPPLPIAERSRIAEARLEREGGTVLGRERLVSSPDGTGSVERALEAGCYRLDLLAEAPQTRRGAYELTVLPDVAGPASVVSVERGDGLDASVTVCAADAAGLAVDFAGAPEQTPVWVLSARWPFPEGLPEAWGNGVRARVASVLRRHGVRVSGSPVDQALGVQGPTLMPVPVEPGACYVGVLAALEGRPLGLALAATPGGLVSHNHGGLDGDGTLVSFCAHSENRALIEADARGSDVIWMFAMWQAGRLPLGEELPR
ncbi:MAG TPA: hypothetical protein VKY73_03440 [Polyangiaceae bacterium]|nr:hypothetical protein [Polyangiaceae bacterium]